MYRSLQIVYLNIYIVAQTRYDRKTAKSTAIDLSTLRIHIVQLRKEGKFAQLHYKQCVNNYADGPFSALKLLCIVWPWKLPKPPKGYQSKTWTKNFWETRCKQLPLLSATTENRRCRFCVSHALWSFFACLFVSKRNTELGDDKRKNNIISQEEFWWYQVWYCLLNQET